MIILLQLALCSTLPLSASKHQSSISTPHSHSLHTHTHAHTTLKKKKKKNSGTFWYHSHYDVQYADGARGALIVNAPPSLSQLEDAADSLRNKVAPPGSPAPPLPPPPPTPENAPKFVAPLKYEADVPVLLFDNYHQPYSELQAW